MSSNWDQVGKNAEEILGNQEKLSQFASLNRLSEDMARTLLERLAREPALSEEVKAYFVSGERSADFKGYRAGEEQGYVRGHEAGFAKGAALGILGALGMLTLAGVTWLISESV